MTRQAIYDRLRAIGVTVESADAVAEALEPLPDKKVEAFILWLCDNAINSAIDTRMKNVYNIVKRPK